MGRHKEGVTEMNSQMNSPMPGPHPYELDAGAVAEVFNLHQTPPPGTPVNVPNAPINGGQDSRGVASRGGPLRFDVSPAPLFPFTGPQGSGLVQGTQPPTLEQVEASD